MAFLAAEILLIACVKRIYFLWPAHPRCYALNKFADNLIFHKNGLPRV